MWIFYSGICVQHAWYSGELYTPIFAMARVVGWSAHRMEELVNADKIILRLTRVLQKTYYQANR